jgi:hypothetical protein
MLSEYPYQSGIPPGNTRADSSGMSDGQGCPPLQDVSQNSPPPLLPHQYSQYTLRYHLQGMRQLWKLLTYQAVPGHSGLTQT